MANKLNELLEFAGSNQLNVIGYDEVTGVVNVDGRMFIPVLDKPKLFNSDMNIIVNDYEKAEAEGSNADYVFEFGGNYYWTPRTSKTIEFNDFRYIGKCRQELEYEFSHLGVHGGYEILGGSGSYASWCAKAKFFGHKSVGICELNTLAGAVAFQTECVSAKIKPIIGMTVVVTHGTSWKYRCKVYAKNEIGWKNLLKIHKNINVDSEVADTVDMDFISNHSEGLIFVFGWGSKPMPEMLSLFEDAYYQIDSIIYVDAEYEKVSLNNVKHYLENYVGDISPVLINDTYYLDKDYMHIKGKINESSGKFYNKSRGAHYKNCDESFMYLAELFVEDDDRLFDIFEMAVENSVTLADSVEFKIETGVIKMPKFDLKSLPERYKKIKTNVDLFWKVIGDGMEAINDKFDNPKTDKVYSKRIEMEAGIIEKGGFIDYFLIVWDIIRWANENGIYTGVGRGSAGGSIVAYLMGITRIDPIEYNLPFERFMNEGRLIGSLPDIDSDFEGYRRDDVKRYVESKYGSDYVCSIGSYSKLRVKAAMNEMWKDKAKAGTINYMTAMILDRDGDWDEIFKSANKKKPFKDFIKEEVAFINNVRLVLDQPKNVSMHAAAIVIVPKEDGNGNPMTIFDWMPVTKRDGVLVSEWEGTYLEKCGFMKNDILGTRQLDKFRLITDTIKKTTGEDVDIYSIPVDDEQAYRMFQEGNTEDTFHFGSAGLKSYTRTVKPLNINDLIDIISLHRPGIMDVGMHKEYVNVRFGRSKPHYDFGLKEITKGTNGILIYQEQIMEAVKQIGGFTMAEADDVRRAMGKKKIEIITPYKKQFIAGALKRGCPENEVEALWHKLEVFSGYGFNRAHAAAYSMIGYAGMWFKVNYPLQFWSAAFQHAKDEDVSNFVSEMNRTGTVNIAPPDINSSDGEFTTNYDTNTIHWSLNKIKQVGGVATDEVLTDRKTNGKYFSIEELFKRVTRKKVNRKVITSLIFSGCMDSLYNIQNVSDRMAIFKEYAKLIDSPVSEMVDTDMAKHNYWWVAKQKLVSGLGIFDYSEVITGIKYKSSYSYMDVSLIQDEANIGVKCVVAGLVIKVQSHSAGHGEFASILIDSNNELLWITCWNEVWEGIKNSIIVDADKHTAKILVISGRIANSSYRGVNVIETIAGSKAAVVDTRIQSKDVSKS